MGGGRGSSVAARKTNKVLTKRWVEPLTTAVKSSLVYQSAACTVIAAGHGLGHSDPPDPQRRLNDPREHRGSTLTNEIWETQRHREVESGYVPGQHAKITKEWFSTVRKVQQGPG